MARTLTDKQARGEKTANIPVVSWDDWHDVDRAGDPSQFARCLTTTPLAGAATYTQTAVDRFARTALPDAQELGILLVDRVRGLIWADQAGTLYLEQSDDNATWSTVGSSVAVSANVSIELPWSIVTKRYYRFRYVNGATIQTAFRLYQMVGSAEATGTKADTAATDSTSSWSVVALLKGALKVFLDVWDSVTHALNVKVTGSLPAGTAELGRTTLGAYSVATGANRTMQTAGYNAVAAENLLETVMGAWNGATIDMLRSGQIDATVLTGLLNTMPLMYDSNGPAYRALRAAISNGDGSSRAFGLATAPYLDNGGTLDRQRNNTESTPLASAARTASVNSADFTVYNGAMLAAFLDVTAASGTSPTLDVTVKVKDPASGKYFVIGTFTQATGITNQALFIGGGADVEFATRTYRVETVIAGTSPSFTFSVGAAATVA